MASAFGVEFWQKETTLYEAPHLRLQVMARWLRKLPERSLLDVGCSTARLQSLLPVDFRYFGCDISDHARTRLPQGHFAQLDFNNAYDFSVFTQQGIDVVHIGGVLEYLSHPGELLRKLHNLVPRNSPLVLSMINFASKRYLQTAAHHPAWIFKPRLEGFLALLEEHGWSVERMLPFLGKGGPKNWWFQHKAKRLGPYEPWIQLQARQFILLARARD